MITKDFIKELSKMSSITDKVILKYPITTLNSEAIDMLVNIDTSKLGCQEFPDTGIYELNKFVHMFALFDNPEITRTNNAIEFETPGTKSVYTISDLSVMENFDQKSSIIESLDNFPEVAKVDISVDVIKQIKQASSIYNELNVLTIEGKSNDLYLYLDAHNRFNSSNNTFSKEFLNHSTMDFKLKINIENFIKLPMTNYTLKIKYNENKNAFRILFESEFFKILISKIAD